MNLTQTYCFAHLLLSDNNFYHLSDTETENTAKQVMFRFTELSFTKNATISKIVSVCDGGVKDPRISASRNRISYLKNSGYSGEMLILREMV